MRILVTSMGSTASQNLVWALRRDRDGGWFIAGADARPVHGGMDLPDVAVTVPMGGAPDYVERLRELVARLEIDLLVPVMEPELDAVARSGPWSCPVLLSSREAIEVSRSKRRLAGRFLSLGLDPPRVLEPASDLLFPVFVRPDRGTGSGGARRVEDRGELRRLLDGRSDLVVTEHVEGGEFSVDGYADPDGSLVHAICRRREEVRHGVAVRSTVVELEPGLRRKIHDVSRDLRLFGFFNVQFLRDASGRNRFFDLNPRLGGAMALSFAAGLDAPRLLRRAVGTGSDGGVFETRCGLGLVRRYHNLIVPPAAERPKPG